MVARSAYRLGLPLPVVVGLRMALEPGHGRTAVPVRPALVGAVVGVLGVLAALTFRAGVLDAAADPVRFGQTYSLSAWSGFDGEDWYAAAPVQQAWARDPDVLAVNDTRVGVATVGATSVTVYTHAPVGSRALPVATLSGRLAAAPDEITIAPGSARASGAEVGDVLAVRARADQPVRMRVTGIALVPEGPHNGYSEGGWLTGAGYQRLFPDRFFKFHQSLVALRPGADVAAGSSRLAATAAGVAGGPVELEPPIPPLELTQLRNVRLLPLALGVFLALLGVGATGHALATAVRRRRHDVAVLRALGITRGQSRLVVVAHAATLGAIGLLLGVPLGIALGRTLWRVVADRTPLLYAPPLAPLAVALSVPVALGIAALLASLPARRAARLRLADVLRAE